jgi:UDP-2-acetamido-2-deoxy-ribo-hexuluronate aminotransferase
MKPIQMVDLVGQYQKIKPEVDAALLQVVQSAAFINGPEVKEFEKELAAYSGREARGGLCATAPTRCRSP